MVKLVSDVIASPYLTFTQLDAASQQCFSCNSAHADYLGRVQDAVGGVDIVTQYRILDINSYSFTT